MSFDVAPIGPTDLAAAAGASARAPRGAADTVALSSGDVPATPPAEVLEAVDAAQRAYRQLHAQGRELHFVVPEDGGRVTVEVRDLDGHVLRTIPPSQALDVATGGSLD